MNPQTHRKTMNSYINSKIQQLMNAAGMTITDMKREFDITDHNTARRLFGGSEDIKVGRLLAIANYFNVPVSDFFYSDNAASSDTPLVVPVVAEDKPVRDLDELKKMHEMELNHLKEVMDIRLHYEIEIAELKKDNDYLKAELKKRDELSDSNPVSVHTIVHDHYAPEETLHSYVAEDRCSD